MSDKSVSSSGKLSIWILVMFFRICAWYSSYNYLQIWLLFKIFLIDHFVCNYHSLYVSAEFTLSCCCAILFKFCTWFRQLWDQDAQEVALISDEKIKKLQLILSVNKIVRPLWQVTQNLQVRGMDTTNVNVMPFISTQNNL